MNKKIHKITKKPYTYECGDGCCTEFGETWMLDGREISSSPCEDTNLLALLAALDIRAELSLLDEEGEEQTYPLSNFAENEEIEL